ncbi:MAG: peptide-methionine (R)-S-oxide reductase [Pseudomonadota bacterium]
MPVTSPSRRAFLASAAFAGAGTALASPSAAKTVGSDYQFEVTHTDEEWFERLTPEQYEILRQNGTEWPKSSPLWNDYRAGEFHCQGCGLHVYRSEWRVELDKGWVFFAHAVPNAVMMDIDKAANYTMNPSNARTMIEVHCRRCGSHLGHLLRVDGHLVHCINGAALDFRPANT